MLWSKVIDEVEALQAVMRAGTDQRSFYDIWGIAAMRTTPADMADMLGPLLTKLNIAAAIADPSLPLASTLHRIVLSMQSEYLPQFYQNHNAHISFINTLVAIEYQLDNVIGGDNINKALAAPKQFASKLRSASIVLDNTLSELDGIGEQLKTIRAAHDAAVDLPVTLKDIEDAKTQLTASRTASASRIGELDALLNKGTSVIFEIERQAKEVETVSSRVLDSYRALTSQGLAQAFHAKERKLNSSMLVWLGILMLSLFLMAAIGYLRFPEIQAALSGQIHGKLDLAARTAAVATGTVGAAPNWGVVLVEVVLAILSLGPPTWLAIVATKQISQRFKLAEDYGYKAAVSAAYEGYRSEASRYGEEFQTKLFTSALDRLDEQPLRFVDHETGGTPVQELLNAIAKTVDPKILKEFMDKFTSTPNKSKNTREKSTKADSGKDDE
ncbi:hypothetical protein [Massilia sp. IC2-476]|uniref:hypothetical protein n=1 Tax=Massilia sp. IC2-476 TaxID=2887199 RepID=UPI001D104BB5|nr:hypothetical protein [Massilia sp. IC2-476]MCC2973266.1 hypothetical protein [Massilia sp. IC2-476]